MRGPAAASCDPPDAEWPPPVMLADGHAIETLIEGGWEAAEPVDAIRVTVYERALTHLRAVDQAGGDGEV